MALSKTYDPANLSTEMHYENISSKYFIFNMNKNAIREKVDVWALGIRIPIPIDS